MDTLLFTDALFRCLIFGCLWNIVVGHRCLMQNILILLRLLRRHISCLLHCLILLDHAHLVVLCRIRRIVPLSLSLDFLLAHDQRRHIPHGVVKLVVVPLVLSRPFAHLGKILLRPGSRVDKLHVNVAFGVHVLEPVHHWIFAQHVVQSGLLVDTCVVVVKR